MKIYSFHSRESTDSIYAWALARALLAEGKKVTLLELQLNTGLPLWCCLPLDRILQAEDFEHLPHGWQRPFVKRSSLPDDYLEAQGCHLVGVDAQYNRLTVLPIGPYLNEIDPTNRAMLSSDGQRRFQLYLNDLAAQTAAQGQDALVILNDPGMSSIPGSVITWTLESKHQQHPIFLCSSAGFSSLFYEMNVFAQCGYRVPLTIVCEERGEAFSASPFGSLVRFTAENQPPTTQICHILREDPRWRLSKVTDQDLREKVLVYLRFVKVRPPVRPELAVSTSAQKQGGDAWLASTRKFVADLTVATTQLKDDIRCISE